ncbi:hypothetical protein LDENG_00154960 [Lucifuga dentata]|nr:hypothetical protein LDENG_00154960 [Lucifuga dentata]
MQTLKMNLSSEDATNRTKTNILQENVENALDTETRLQQGDLTNRSEQKEEDVRMKTNRKENKLVNPLSLFKEDLSQLKVDLMSVFKDKELRTEDQPVSPSTERQNKSSSTLSLIKEDFSSFKEELTSVFYIGLPKDKDAKPADLKRNPSTERNLKTTNPLSLLKEDFSQFKDDLSNVFKIGLSKEKDKTTAPNDESFKSKLSKAENSGTGRSEEDQNGSSTRDQTGCSETKEENIPASERREDTTSDAFRGNLLERNKETDETEKNTDDQQAAVNQLEDGNISEIRSFSEALLSEEMIQTSNTDEHISEDGGDSKKTSLVSGKDERMEEEEEDKPSLILPLDKQTSGISLVFHTDSNKDDTRDQPGGETWSVKKFACYLTFDPSTANSELLLSNNNRKATRTWLDQRPLEHHDMFRFCPQVLCREAMLDRFYWEVAWSGGADIGVAYNNISRGGAVADCLLGYNNQSWSLECREGSYTPCQDSRRFKSSSPKPFTHRIGVYLDWHAGSISFYSVSTDAMVHLHTFTTTFTEPLYAGFWVWAYDGSVALCQVQQDWEHLLQ